MSVQAVRMEPVEVSEEKEMSIMLFTATETLIAGVFIGLGFKLGEIDAAVAFAILCIATGIFLGYDALTRILHNDTSTPDYLGD